MRKYILLGDYLLLLAYITSRDDGCIYEKTKTLSEEGHTLKINGKINGISKWPDGYSVVVVGFSDESEYTVITRTIPTVEDGEIQATMTGVSDKVATIELCIINKLRRRVINFQSMDDLTAVDDTVPMDVGTVNVDMYHDIQEKVFNATCTRCHGGSSSAAANPYLTEGKSYEALVNHPSEKVGGMLSVKPGSAQENVLHALLNTAISSTWGYDHSKEIILSPILTLIDDWVSNGAQEQIVIHPADMSNKGQQNVQSEKTLTEIFRYNAGGEASGYHIITHSTRPEDTYEEQLNVALSAYDYLLTQELKGAVTTPRRYFLSDVANQADTLLALITEGSDHAFSIMKQPPLDGTKIALWVYLLTDVQTQVLHNGLFEVEHSAYRHLWGGSAFNRTANSECQTRLLLNDYAVQLMEQDCKLADNCVCTWFFVQNIDVNYTGVMKARGEVFITQNLTEKTHYISSTGTDGRYADPRVLVQMNTCAVAGPQPGQIHFLYAPTHLDPTYGYGVSLERGTYIDCGDRRQVFISGTASINSKSDMVYPGDIHKQTERMWENVETLLKKADYTFEDLGQMIVYLRDITDYIVVKVMYDKRFPHTPKVLVHVPVRRPGWLIETECTGVKECKNKEYAPF